MNIFVNVNYSKEKAIEIKNRIINFSTINDLKIVEDIDKANLIISIGGDGTFIESARLIENTNIPLIGVNLGSLGYLTEINPDGLENALTQILNGNYYLESRMMLQGKVLRNGETICENKAINDITLTKNALGILRFDLYIDDVLINKYTADGIIICTPTGSTAYNLSCGGPIIEPNASIITITPLAPHTMINRSLVLSDNNVIKIKITEIRESQYGYIIFDGINNKIKLNDEIIIKKANTYTSILRLNKRGFLDIIRDKMI